MKMSESLFDLLAYMLGASNTTWCMTFNIISDFKVRMTQMTTSQMRVLKIRISNLFKINNKSTTIM